MKTPAEFRESMPMHLHEGVISTTTDVWDTLMAAKDGDIARLTALGEKCPALLWCQYDYTSPMQFGVREGQVDIVRFLIENGAFEDAERNHPFLELLEKLANDRGFDEIVELLMATESNPALVHHRGDTGKIDRGYDDEQVRFQAAVDNGDVDAAGSMLSSQPDLALMDDAFWGEGIMATAAKKEDRRMLELLLGHGATVPNLSKWGARYYFKHYDTAKFLLENGMDPNHMNWREFTLLHDFAFTGDVEKIKLLLDFGADINAIDEEYHTTPLGYAKHFGNQEAAQVLLDRGADRS